MNSKLNACHPHFFLFAPLHRGKDKALGTQSHTAFHSKTVQLCFVGFFSTKVIHFYSASLNMSVVKPTNCIGRIKKKEVSYLTHSGRHTHNHRGDFLFDSLVYTSKSYTPLDSDQSVRKL